MKVTINGTEKEVTISPIYTRKVDRGFNEIMFEWLKVNSMQLKDGGVDVDLSRMQKANDFLIISMSNLTQEELDEMSVEDYNKVLEEIEKVKIPSK